MIIIYGEILVDMIQRANEDVFDYFIGGAPFNVTYCGLKFNNNIKFYGNVGNDLFGKYIISKVNSYSIDSSNISIDNNHNTTLAVVKNDENGERNFCFLRNNCADYYLPYSSLDDIKNGDIIHLGSLMLSTNYGYKFAKELIKKAKENNKIISFDINYRDDIFKDSKEAIRIYKSIYKHCDVIKLSEDELYLFTNETDINKALRKFKNQKVFVTLGKNGSLLYSNEKVYKNSSIKVDVIDTTGAGDAFYGTILALIDTYGYDKFFKDEQIILASLKKANIQGAFATTSKGALSGIVNKEIIEKHI